MIYEEIDKDKVDRMSIEEIDALSKEQRRHIVRMYDDVIPNKRKFNLVSDPEIQRWFNSHKMTEEEEIYFIILLHSTPKDIRTLFYETFDELFIIQDDLLKLEILIKENVDTNEIMEIADRVDKAIEARLELLTPHLEDIPRELLSTVTEYRGKIMDVINLQNKFKQYDNLYRSLKTRLVDLMKMKNVIIEDNYNDKEFSVEKIFRNREAIMREGIKNEQKR